MLWLQMTAVFFLFFALPILARASSYDYFDITAHGVSEPNSKCESWRLNAEMGNIIDWVVVPSGCEGYISNYMLGGQYLSDTDTLAFEAKLYAKNVALIGDGKDAWIFDIDDTALSHVSYYARNHFGAMPFNRTNWIEWETLAVAPALEPMLSLYYQLIDAQWSVFFLTGRDEKRRNVTEENLLRSGYSGWAELILRQEADRGLPAKVYKSAKRLELQERGYQIWGNMGDQWSDLNGYASGERIFKVPNPMYYIA